MENKIKLLIVEDEALIAENIRFMVEDLGFEVVDICHNYENAFNSLIKNSFDIALLDINLGGEKTGFDVAIQINKILPRKPIIF